MSFLKINSEWRRRLLLLAFALIYPTSLTFFSILIIFKLHLYDYYFRSFVVALIWLFSAEKSESDLWFVMKWILIDLAIFGVLLFPPIVLFWYRSKKPMRV